MFSSSCSKPYQLMWLLKMKETLMNVDQDAKGDMEHHHDLLQKRLEKKKQQKAEKANQYNNKIDNHIDRIHDAETKLSYDLYYLRNFSLDHACVLCMAPSHLR